MNDPCEAVLVGLELQGKPRALAPEGCEDRAANEPTRLLDDDLQLSDLGSKECARLCNHHSQLYMLSCQGRKCSVVSCFSKVHGAHRGTPLCKKHLSVTGRAQSPAPAQSLSSLGQGLLRKAGAAFGEQLGGGSESFTLQASDCATASVEQIENWTPPTEHKIEPRARAPSTFLTWLRYAENAVKVFGSAYGLEHVQERMKFVQALREAHEEDENAFPFTYCMQLFAEMTAVWCEEVREKRRGAPS